MIVEETTETAEITETTETAETTETTEIAETEREDLKMTMSALIAEKQATGM